MIALYTHTHTHTHTHIYIPVYNVVEARLPPQKKIPVQHVVEVRPQKRRSAVEHLLEQAVAPVGEEEGGSGDEAEGGELAEHGVDSRLEGFGHGLLDVVLELLVRHTHEHDH